MDSDTTSSVHKPLADLRLILAAGYPLECSLNVYGLDDVPGHTAIAYVWGDPLLEGHVEGDGVTSLKPSTMLSSSCTTSNVSVAIRSGSLPSDVNLGHDCPLLHISVTQDLVYGEHPKGLFVLVMENFS